MANIELEIISNIVKTGDLRPARKRGLTPSSFETEEARDYYQWLWDQFHSPAHRGEVPDLARFSRHFPNFRSVTSRNSVAALIDEMMTEKGRREADKLIGEMGEYLDDGEDPALVLQAYMPRLRKVSLLASETSVSLMADGYDDLRQEYDTKEIAGGVTGVPFPWPHVNKATGGMHPEDFIVFYGRPKNMKTWVACACIAHAYLCNHRVYAFSKEMRVSDMRRRVAALIAEVDYFLLKAANLPLTEKEKYFAIVESLKDLEDMTRVGAHQRSIAFDSDKGRRRSSSVDEITARAEQFEPELLVVDGFYLLTDGRSGTRTADWKQIAHISQDLKGMAQFLEVPVLGTTQANRAKAAAPSDDMDDLSYADAIGQDADFAARVFKGPHPTRENKTAICMYFSGAREADLKPMLINANPGEPFEVVQEECDVTAFLDAKAASKPKQTPTAAPAKRPGAITKKRPAKRKRIYS